MQDPYGEIQRLVALLPGSARDVLHQARVFRDRGEDDFALELLERAVERHPINEFNIELAKTLAGLRQFREAMSGLVNVLKVDPDNAEAMLIMAESLGRCGESDRAFKMLERAAQAGATLDMVREIRARIESPSAEHTLEAIIKRVDSEPEPRRHTVMGGPAVAAPTAEPPPGQRRPLNRITTGTFVDLEKYEAPAADNEQSLLQVMPDIGLDQEFDQLLSDMGVPVENRESLRFGEEPPTAAYREDVAGPQDMTTALVIDDDALLMDDDHLLIDAHEPLDRVAEDETQAIVFDDEIFGLETEDWNTSQSPDAIPYDDRPRREPTPGPAMLAGGFEQHRLGDPFRDGSSSVEVDDAAFFDSNSFEDDLGAAEPKHFEPAPQPRQVVAPAGPAVPARPMTPAKTAESPRNRRMILTVLGIGFVVVACVAIVAVSGISERTGVEEFTANAQDASSLDTHLGYVQASENWLGARDHSGFVPVSIPGSEAPRLKREARAQLAWTLAYRVWRFGDVEPASLDAAFADAPGDHPTTKAGSVFALLVRTDPYKALEVARLAAESHAGDLDIQEALVVALIAANDIPGAQKSSLPLRAIENPSLRIRLLLNVLDGKREDASALTGFRKILDESAGHIDARIERARLLTKNEEEQKEALAALAPVLDGDLKESASTLQRMRALQVSGRILILQKDNDTAELRLKEAVTLAPQRNEAYGPLLAFYLANRRFDEVDRFVKKARNASAFGPEVVFAEAERLIRVSKPDEAILILGQANYDDVRREWLRGLAYLDMYREQDALAAFRAGTKLMHEFHPVKAFAVAYEGLVDASKRENAAYALKGMREDQKEEPYVFLASGLYALESALIAKSRKSREKHLEDATRHLKRAVDLADSQERMHFALCRLYTVQLNGKSADRSCEAGKKVNPSFVPGLALIGELRRLQGRYNEAADVLDALLKEHPNDHRLAIAAARTALEARDPDKSQAIVNRWLGKGADERSLKMLEGRIQFEKENYSRAAGYLKDAYEEQKTDGEAAVYYAATLSRLGQIKESDEILQGFLTHPTWDGYAWMELAEIRHRQKDWRNTGENFKGALRRFDANTGPRSRYSQLYAYRAYAARDQYGKWDHPQVARFIELGRKGDPDDPTLNYTAALYHLKKRNPDREAGIRYLNLVIEKAPYRCKAYGALKQLLDPKSDKERLKELASIAKTHDCGEAK